MSVELAERSRPGHPRPANRVAGSWVAALTPGGPEERLARLPLCREIAPARHGGRAFQVHAASEGHLPELARRHGCAVLFEGRLHDREQLRDRLGSEAAGVDSEVELVLLAFRRWGDELPERLHGTFTAIVWDEATERLLAVRDRMGLRPLFHAGFAGGIVLATSPALVALHPRVSTELHRAAMAELLCFRFLDLRETYYANIHRVPPGHRLDWRSGAAPVVRRYWTVRFGNWLDARREDVFERFGAVFDRAVARTLEAGPPAVFLSGGLDSANVTLTASDQLRAVGAPPPVALSLAFPTEVDEVEIQTGVARQLGLELVLLDYWEAAGHERTLWRAAELSADCPQPLINLWRPAYLRLGEEAVRRGCASILTGHGGDEWADAGIDLAADLIRRGNVAELVRLWRMARRSYPTSAPIMFRNLFWRYGARPLLVGAALRGLGPLAPRFLALRRRQFVAASTPDFLAPDPALRRELDRRAEAMLPAPRYGSAYLDQVPRYFESPVVVELQEDGFEAGRRLGIPLLSPFLDPELVELACRIRPEALYAGGRNKGLLRARAAPRLPQLGFERQKKLPATAFMRRLVREQTASTWEATGGVPTLAELGVVDPRKLKQTLDQIVDGTMQRAANLSVFSFSLESWARVRV